MDVVELLKAVGSAVADAKAKEADALKASQRLEQVKADAKAVYDKAVGTAQQAHEQAQAAYRDAQVAGQRLKEQANEALGGVFSVDARVRMG